MLKEHRLEYKNFLPDIKVIIRNAKKTGKNVEAYLTDLKFDPLVVESLAEKAQQYELTLEKNQAEKIRQYELNLEKKQEDIVEKQTNEDMKQMVKAGATEINQKSSRLNFYFFCTLWTFVWAAANFLAVFAGKSKLTETTDIIVYVCGNSIANHSFFWLFVVKIILIWLIGILVIDIFSNFRAIKAYLMGAIIYIKKVTTYDI